MDIMGCLESCIVTDDMADADPNSQLLLIVRDSSTAPGYIKLQAVENAKPLTANDWCKIKSDVESCFKVDRCGRLVIIDIKLTGYIQMCGNKPRNKPAYKTINGAGQSYDMVLSYRCRKWSSCANEWLIRERFFGWPSESTIQKLAKLGFFIVKKGHPFSTEQDLEWRISFSLQERKLMYSLTDVQYKCYVFLKIINHDLIGVESITSYHWKTCLFYAIEKNHGKIWIQKHLFKCVTLCLRLMLSWVTNRFCPNYFIPEENMFDGRLDDSGKELVSNKLVTILSGGVDSLVQIKTDRIGEYIRSRGGSEWLQRLRDKGIKIDKETSYMIQMARTCDVFNIWYHLMIPRYYNLYTRGNAKTFICYLWDTVHDLHNSYTITEHTPEETADALSLFKPYIYICFSSILAAIAMKCENPKVREFLFAGSFITFQSDFLFDYLAGRLKFISVLYTFGLYEDCEWHLGQLDADYIKSTPSLCGCRKILLDNAQTLIEMRKTFQIKAFTCVSFLPSELPVVPDAFKYEMFCFCGIEQESPKHHNRCHWHYLACVDCNVYFYYLKYIVSRKLNKTLQFRFDVMLALRALLYESNVNHKETGFNLLAWMFYEENAIPNAFRYLKESWSKMNHDLNFFTNDKRRQYYNYNSAKLHALVFLYKILFSKRIQSGAPKILFCFECLGLCFTLKKCFSCRFAAYCSNDCQAKNWINHKTVCEILKEF